LQTPKSLEEFIEQPRKMGVYDFLTRRSLPDEDICLPFPASTLRKHAKPPRILDVAINESGDFLYCWVMGHAAETQTSLISWDMGDPTRPILASAANYKCASLTFPWC
jgi:hypothetical protein